MASKNWLTILLTFFVLLILIYWVGGPEKIIQDLADIPVEFFLFTAILFVLDILLRTIRWNLLLKVQNVSINFKDLLLPMYSSSFLNLITPARAGEAVRLFVLKKQKKINYSLSLSVILIEQLINLLSLLFVGLLALLLIIIAPVSISGTIGISGVQALTRTLLPLLVLGYFIGTLAVLFLFIFDSRKLFPIFEKLPVPKLLLKKIFIFLAIFTEVAIALRKAPLKLLTAVLVSSIIWIFEGLMLWMFSISLIDRRFELQIAMFASVMGNFSFVLPLLPGALGIYEAMVALVISFSPYWENGGVFIALVDRTVKTVVLFILGGYATVHLGVQHLERRQILFEAKEASEHAP